MDIKPWATKTSRHRVRSRKSDATTRAQSRRVSSWVWQGMVSAVVLAVMVGIGALMAGAQGDVRTGLQDRFHSRIDLTAQFTAEYDAEILRREAAVGTRAMGGPNPSRAEFEAAVADFGFEAALLLDHDGRVLQVHPPKRALIGTVIAAKYEHLRQAVAGTPAISNVVPSAARAIPVVAFAAPYDTPYGRRVLSGAYDVTTTPLAAHLRHALVSAGGEIHLLDSTGSLVASNLPSTGTVRTIDVVDPALPEAEYGHYLRDGEARWFTTTAVPGSSLRLVASIPEADLYKSVSGTAFWLPWVVFLALGFASLYTIHILFALHRSREDYLALARIDPLTGLSNRRELSALAEGVLANARRTDEPAAVLMMDLDRFKSINDTRGHESGDEVLRVVSARMRHALRDGDLLGRWGGEEFVAFLPATTHAQAMMVGDRVRAAISGTPIAMTNGDAIEIAASIGCAVTVHERIDEVIGRADQAMYLAKRSGDAVMAAPAPPDAGKVGVADPPVSGATFHEPVPATLV